MGLVIHSVLREVMEKWPDHFVAKALVILLDMSLLEKDRIDFLGPQLFFDILPLIRIGR